eukprot:scaffold86776_cov42-Prasinocladus_malaysianus.AAC.1
MVATSFQKHYDESETVDKFAALAPEQATTNGEAVGRKHTEVTSYVENWTQSVQMMDVTEFVRKADTELGGTAKQLLQRCESAVKAARKTDFQDPAREEMHEAWEWFVKHPDIQKVLALDEDKFGPLLLPPTEMQERGKDAATEDIETKHVSDEKKSEDSSPHGTHKVKQPLHEIREKFGNIKAH